MSTDAPRAYESALNRDEWRALRRIRNLQLVALCASVCAFAGILVCIGAQLLDFKTMALTGRAYLFSSSDLISWIGLAVFILGNAGFVIAVGALDRSLCPRCHRKFFGRPEGPKSAQTARRQMKRLTGYWSQRCANCDLSLGLVMLPAP
jgi:hypothetical protein